jgi:hypothetical protein
MKVDLKIRSYSRVGKATDTVAILGVNSESVDALALFLQRLGKNARVGSSVSGLPILEVVTDDRKAYVLTNKQYIVLDPAKRFTVTKRHSFHGTHRRNIREDTSEFVLELQNIWQQVCNSVAKSSDIKPIHPKKKVRHPARKTVSVTDKDTAIVVSNLTLDELTTAWTTFRDALQAKVIELEEKEAFFKRIQCELEQLVNESPIKR